jgi:hypothetical protein
MSELIKEIEAEMAKIQAEEEAFVKEGYAYVDGSVFYEWVSDDYYSMLKKLIDKIKETNDES